MSTINTTNLKNPSSATNNIVLNADGSVTIPNNTRGLTLETAKAFNWNGLTTNTSLDFTSIPSWVKRITVMFNGVSTNGSATPKVRLGTSGGYASSGYVGRAVVLSDGNPSIATSESYATTNGFGFAPSNGASLIYYGHMIITNISGNIWVASLVVSRADNTSNNFGGGAVTLSGTLDRAQVISNGTDTFDAGSINILYE